MLLLVVCLLMAACDAQSAVRGYEHETLATQSAQFRGSPRFLAAAEISVTPGKTLQKPEFVTENDSIDDEERGPQGLSKIKEWIAKVNFKASDLTLRMRKYLIRHSLSYDAITPDKYKYWVKLWLSDDAITAAWASKGKNAHQIFNRWIQLGKSNEEAAKLLLKQAHLGTLYNVLERRGMSMEEIYKFFKDIGLKDRPFSMSYNSWVRHSEDAITAEWVDRWLNAEQIYRRWMHLGKSDEEAAKILLREQFYVGSLFRIFEKRGMSMDDIYGLWRKLGLDDRLITYYKTQD